MTNAAFSTIETVDLEHVTGGFWQSASTYDSKSGHYISTQDYKEKYNVDSVCNSASCYDSKSGNFIGRDDYNDRQRKE
jgi:hypothetical protein